jgi:hypothetical protein
VVFVVENFRTKLFWSSEEEMMVWETPLTGVAQVKYKPTTFNGKKEKAMKSEQQRGSAGSQSAAPTIMAAL